MIDQLAQTRSKNYPNLWFFGMFTAKVLRSNLNLIGITDLLFYSHKPNISNRRESSPIKPRQF